MNKFSFLTQIGMVAIAVTIVLMYIQPKITSIREIQDLTANYEVETQNVSQVNENLKSKIAAIESISPQDAQALARFMPDQVDDIAVLKDLSLILESQSVQGYDIAYKGNTANLQATEETPNEYNSAVEYFFEATFESTYEQLKNILTLIETNDYMLQVSNLKVSEGTEDNLAVELSLTSYARASTTVAVAP
ncbi:MAG: hypothetical protein V4606_00435 [Patescibacteria group bacterium]